MDRTGRPGRQAGQAEQNRQTGRLYARAIYQLFPGGPTFYNARFTKPEGSDIHSHTPGDPTRGVGESRQLVTESINELNILL